MDDSTKRTLTILGVIVVVLLALFVVTVVQGTGAGCSCGTRESWKARLLGSEPVKPGQLSGCTTKLAEFTINVGCELKIAAADARSRQLVLKAINLIELHLVTEADGRRIVTKAEIKPGQEKTISIGKDGQTLGLLCKGSTTCQARVR